MFIRCIPNIYICNIIYESHITYNHIYIYMSIRTCCDMRRDIVCYGRKVYREAFAAQLVTVAIAHFRRLSTLWPSVMRFGANALERRPRGHENQESFETSKCYIHIYIYNMYKIYYIIYNICQE